LKIENDAEDPRHIITVSPVKANGTGMPGSYACQWYWQGNTKPIEEEESRSIKIDASAVL
jgi:hypothetical protein